MIYLTPTQVRITHEYKIIYRQRKIPDFSPKVCLSYTNSQKLNLSLMTFAT